MSAPCSATAMQITNDILWFRMMKWQHSGDGSARCLVYGFRELTPNINNQKETTADCLPLLVPDRDCRTLEQWESSHLVTFLSLVAGWSDSASSEQDIVQVVPGTSAQHGDFGQAPGPMRNQGSCSGGRAFWRHSENFCSAYSHGGSGAGAEILL